MSAVNSNETHQVPPQQTTQEPFEGAKSPNSDDDYNFPEFTEQEFAQLDAVFNQHLNETLDAAKIDHLCEALDDSTSDKPQVVIEYEAEVASSAKLTHKQAHLGRPAKYHNISPFDKHRFWKLLSVSDLVAPAWCELQFDYGLRQKRYKKLEDRPASFVSGKGKTIVVGEATAKRNDRTLKGGRIVHERLEREIRPEKIYVPVTSIEEKWATRLLDMIECIQDLMDIGFCREMPVFGIIHDHTVLGVIDEVAYTPILSAGTGEHGIKRSSISAPSTPRKPKRTRSDHSPARRDLHAIIQPSSPQTRPAASISTLVPSSHVLRLFDNKTRRVRSLPSDRDALSSRLQLMLYHRLLQGLISTSFQQTMVFDEFWTRIKADPLKPFSRQFCDQSGLPLNTEVADEQDPGRVWCLNDLANMWKNIVLALGVDGVDQSLTLVYRTRGFPKVKKRRPTTDRGGRRDVRGEQLSTEEEMQIAQVIRASLKDLGIEDETILDQAVLGTLQRMQDNGGSEEVRTVDSRGLQSLESVESSPASARRQETGTGDSSGESEGDDDILGSKTFPIDHDVLDNHLDRVLDWWHGIRPPKGVEIEDSGRCRSCEYREGCEWRNDKAQEALNKACAPDSR